MASTATFVWLLCGAVFGFALPIGLLLWWRRTRRAKLTPFFVGALVWLVFAAVLEQLLHNVCVYGDNGVARALVRYPYLYMLYGGLAAGVFEETGRFVAFRWLIGKKRFPERDTAVTYGIGHGGVEAMVTLGLNFAVYALLAALRRTDGFAAAMVLAGGDATNLSRLLAVVGQMKPSVCLLAMVERLGAVIFHIALSCFVFLAARDKRQWTFFPFAILLHAIADMPAALYQRGLLPLWSTELWLWVVALYALRSARKCYLEEMDP